MYEELKKEILEIVKIVKTCPENLQEKCFELLFSHCLSKYSPPKPAPGGSPEATSLTKFNPTTTAFLQRFTLTEAQLRKGFHISESSIQLLFSDLKVEKTAKKQIRLSLLLGIKNAVLTGEFKVPIEELRMWCVNYGAYDAANFSRNLRSKKSYFVRFQEGEDLELSNAGQKEAAEIIKELST